MLFRSSIALVVVLASPTIPAEGQTRGWVTPEQVRRAIEKGITFLKNEQKTDGSWGDWMGQPGGVTCLCTLALLNAGVKPSDDHMKRALSHVRDLRPDSTYALSLQTMVLCQAEPENDVSLIRKNVAALLAIQKTQDVPRKGSWAYRRTLGDGDNSNTQFANLALYEAARVGVSQPTQDRNWRLAKAYWEGCQNPDGSWGYYKGVPGTGSMTCAGIASLVICNEMVEPDADAKLDGGRIECCRRADADEDHVERGLRWLGRHFSVERNPGARQWLLYYLYGVERVGRMTAQRFIGGHDWYREGCEKLVRDLSTGELRDFWKGVGHAEDDPQIATSLALLFLSKGRRPVLLGKLKYAAGEDWNHHRNDVNRLTRYVEPRWGLDLTWQVIDLRAASVDDLMQCPVLFMSGSQDPLPSSAEGRRQLGQKLRDYLDRGGFLFVEANCRGKAFDRGLRELMRIVFPEPEYRLRALPPEHPIWRAEEQVDPRFQRPMLGIEFGCRTSVVYCPPYPEDAPGPSLSCLWELSRSGEDRSLPAAVRAQVEAALSVGINVLAYATNRELKTREQFLREPERAGPADSIERGKLYIANLRHPGGCTAAPRALVNLLEAAAAQLKIRVGAEDREIRITDEALFDYHLVFMHGRNRFRLTEEERERLRTFVERGGMVLANSICASQPFTDSFQSEMAQVFPKHALKTIPVSDPLLSPKYGGFDLKTVTRRDPETRGASGPMRANLRKVPPLLKGVEIDGRWAVVFSPYDLSCALEKQGSLECKGYTREDAARIGLNVLLYSLHE